jgi:hypothetical protein
VVIIGQVDEHQESHQTNNDNLSYGVGKHLNDNAMFISRAVIVKLRDLSEVLQSFVPSHMRLLTSIISSYLPPLDKWVR